MSQSGVRSRVSEEATALVLVALAAASWVLTLRISADMGADMNADMSMEPMSAASFVLSWTLMMAAMMLPAVTPVVRLYQRAAAAGRVAPTGYFVAAYLMVWALTALPAYGLWRALATPLAEGETWALRVAGATLLLAGAYQLTPLKEACLRHCRSPMSYFMRLRGSLDRPGGAFRAGLMHAAYCFGCCVALMAVLVAAAAMNLWWALVLAAAVFVERNVRWGAEFATGLGALLAVFGATVLLSPPLLSTLI